MDEFSNDARNDGCSTVGCVTGTVREHPIPVALAGIGLGWLLFAGLSRGNGDDLAQSEYSDQIDPNVDGPVDDIHGERRGVGERVRATARSTMGSVRGAGEAAAETAAELGQRARSGADTAWHEAERLTGAARRRTRRVGRSFADAVDERPLLLAALGLAVGAAIGAALPRTRQEREWVGGTADDVRARATGFAREQWHRGERIVEKAAEAAKAEAERQGLTPEDLSAKAGKVAEAGKAAGETEMDR